MRNCINILLLLFLLPSLSKAQHLANGEWLKLAVTADGAYKLDRQFLKQHGLLPNEANPANYRLFGYGGGMLPQENTVTPLQGLPEVALMQFGNGDTSFDEQDALFFYAQGPDALSLDSESGHFSYQKNIYSDTAYYFLTYDAGNAGPEIEESPYSGTQPEEITSYRTAFIIEGDEENLIESGRKWVGERMGYQASRTYSLPFKSLLPEAPLSLQVHSLSALHSTGTLDIMLNSQALGSLSLPAINPTSTYAEKGHVLADTFKLASVASQSNHALELQLSQQGSGGSLYFDYLLLNASLSLEYTGEAFHFWPDKNTRQAAFSIANAPQELQVWDISNPQSPRQLPTSYSGNQLKAFYEGAESPALFTFTPDQLELPIAVGKTANQNLSSIRQAEFLIITHPRFKAQAERLAAHRQANDQLQTKVATVQQIYNEFSSGRQDVSALRNFIRHVYTTGNGQLRYVLFFGRGSYDYRNKEGKGWNLVPLYESRNSTHPIYSYASDDYFGFLDEEEGLWQENQQGNHQLDIGLGRLPVITAEEARSLVDKIIHYDSSPSALGNWRNKLTFIADDGDYNVHQKDAERLSEIASSLAPSLQLKKVYFDAYVQEQTPVGEQAPAIQQAVRQAFEEGSLLINYTGHGNRDFWAGEKVLTKADIPQLHHPDKLPVLVTATCEFGQHDGLVRSAAEELLLNPSGGAIALLTTSRPVFSSTNYAINQAFYRAALQADASLRLGDIIKETKNNSLDNSGVVNRNFILLGDPSMTLALPKRKVQLTALHDATTGQQADTLKAFQRLHLSGQVLTTDSTTDASFNGSLLIELYDKSEQLSTRGQDPKAGSMSYELQSNVIFRGSCQVVNGEWESELIIPKAIRYELGISRFKFYALDNSRQLDASGSAERLLGGSQAVALNNQPPQLYAYLNDSSFSNGSQVEPNAQLFIHFKDEQGIDISPVGVGQQLSAWLDDSVYIDLSPYYAASAGGFTEGSLSYPLKQLAPGQHRLEISASDTHQNTSKTELSFVVGKNELQLLQFYPYPNPLRLSQPLKVRLEHNRPKEKLIAEFQIYDAHGKQIWKQTSSLNALDRAKQEILLDCTSLKNNKTLKGLYFLTLLLRSETDGSFAQKSSRLIIID